MIERTTVRLPKDLLARAKRKALAEDRTLDVADRGGVALVVSGTQKKAKTERILPRSASAAVGPFPGIDISNSAALQEMEDLETSSG